MTDRTLRTLLGAGLPRGLLAIIRKVIDDTHPRVHARIDAIFAAMTPSERFSAMSSMTEFVCNQSMAAIAATMPNAPRSEVVLRWSEIHYGSALTERVRRHLADRDE